VVWNDALTELSYKISSVPTSRARLAKLKRGWTGSSTSFDVPISFTGFMLKRLEPTTLTVAKAAVIAPAPKMNPLAIGLSERQLEGVLAMHSAANFARKHLTESKELWAARYASWSEAYALNPAEYSHRKSVMYGTAAAAFRALTVDTLLMPESRFVDGSNARKTYIAMAAKGYARKRRLKKPAKLERHFRDAQDIAEVLDDQYEPIVTFVDVEQFCHERLSEFAADIVNQELPEEPEPPIDLPGDTVVEETVEEEYDDDLDDLLFGDYEEESLESRVLRSYDSPEIAEAHARANGYDTFSAAVEALGERARHDTELEYTLAGLAAMARADKEVMSDSILA